jgi:hypothetical protein
VSFHINEPVTLAIEQRFAWIRRDLVPKSGHPQKRTLDILSEATIKRATATGQKPERTACEAFSFFS